MSHLELVERAAHWLAGSQKCVFVLTELGRAGETPDAIGWSSYGTSILVECKASISDFYADRGKPWRRHPESAMGHLRFYMTAPGMLKPAQLPEGWGLLECGPQVVRKVVASSPHVRDERGLRCEMALLLNATRRCHGDPRLTGSMRPVRHLEPLSAPAAGEREKGEGAT